MLAGIADFAVARPLRGVGVVEILAYRRRRPEESVLYRAIREHLETFLEHAA